MNPASVLNLGSTVLGAGFVNGVCQANCGGVTAPYPSFSGSVAQALRPWPQYQIINWRFFNYGKSRYDALQLAFEKRMSHGLQAKVAYTYSHLKNNGAETGLGAGGPPVQNPSDFSNMYTVSSDDVPHILSLGWVYELPFGKGKAVGSGATGFVDKVIGGWKVSAMQTYQSGRPLSVTMPNNMSGILFTNAKFPDKAGRGLTGTFKNAYTDSYLNQGGWSAPGGAADALAFGNAPREDSSIRGFKYYNEDFTLMKDTYFGEGKYVRFESDMGNVFNRVYFCNPDTSWQPNNGNNNFGHTGSQCNIPRRIQLGLQLFF
jgi:hypothetical protein